MKIYQEQNVYQASNERLEEIFNGFEHIYFMLSGGKDSSLLLQLANNKAEEMGKTFDCLFVDLEAQYKHTIEHVKELTTLSQIRNFYWVTMPLQLRNAVSVLQPKWVCWSPTQEDIWVREMPENTINVYNHPFDFYELGMEFEDFVEEFQKWYSRKYEGDIATVIGIRSDESLNRYRTIANPNKTVWNGNQWTTLLHGTKDVWNVYPIYDWKTTDVWGAISKFNFKYNEIYELMYKNGVTIHEQRLCQPYGDDQRKGLDQFKALESETWEKVLTRVNGVNFGNIYARTSALGNLKSMKPDDLTWQEYAVFLLESLGLYNQKLMLHYVEKIRKHLDWWTRNRGLHLSMVVDEANSSLESKKMVTSWRRIARAIEKNDFYMKRLGYHQNKSDNKLLKLMIEEYDNLFDAEIIKDTHLLRFYNKEIKNQ